VLLARFKIVLKKKNLTYLILGIPNKNLFGNLGYSSVLEHKLPYVRPCAQFPTPPLKICFLCKDEVYLCVQKKIIIKTYAS
jgi:hypothetical protein